MEIKDYKILIVDDSDISIENVEQSLLSVGFTQLKKCNSVAEAISLLGAELKTKPVDIIVCDHHIGDRLGIELLKFVRANVSFKSIKFFACTSDGQREVILNYLKSGADGFINKPFKSADLIEKINKLAINRD